ncbi:unnamed protein product [Diamesa serratosioi]
MDSNTEVFDYFQPVTLASKIIKLLGFWHDQSSSILYRVFGAIIHITFIELFWVLQVVYLFKMADNVKDISFLLGGIITYTAISSKTLTFVYQLSKIKQLLKMLEQLHHLTKSEKNTDKRKLKNQVLNIHKIFKTFSTICLLTALPGLYFLILHYDERKMPYKVWIPIDYKHNDYCFWVVAVYLLSGPAYGALIEATLDTFPVMFICIGTGLLEELCDRMNSIGTEIEVMNLQAGTSKMKLTAFQKVLKRKQRDKEHLKELLKCIEIHQKIQEFMVKTSEIFSTMIFVQGMFCSINICTTAFQLSLSSPTVDSWEFVHFISYLAAITLEIYLPCYYGNNLRIASEKLSTKLFHTNWIFESKDFKIAMKLFMENVKKPMKISALNIFDLDLDNFLKICNFAYSLYALFQNIDT